MDLFWLCLVSFASVPLVLAESGDDGAICQLALNQIKSLKEEVNNTMQMNVALKKKLKAQEDLIATLKEKPCQTPTTSSGEISPSLEDRLQKLESKLNITSGGSREKCPENIGKGSSCYWSDNYGCYCVYLDYYTWRQAIDICTKFDMQLVSIETAGEQQHLTQLLRENLNGNGYASVFWTSGSDEEKEGEWKWVSTGQPIKYTNWHDGEPNNVGATEGPGEDILVLASTDPFDWFDYPRFDGTVGIWHRYFICEGH